MDLEFAKKLLELGTTGILALAIAYILRVFAEIRKTERADQEAISTSNHKRVDSMIDGMKSSVAMLNQLAGTLTQASAATGSVIQDARELVRETRELAREFHPRSTVGRPSTSGNHPHPPGASTT